MERIKHVLKSDNINLNHFLAEDDKYDNKKFIIFERKGSNMQ